MQTYEQFYANIIKPSFAPPNWTFGLAWGIIYPLIAVAFIWTLYLVFKKGAPKELFWLFVANMVANFLFTPIQLGLSALWPASLDILVVLVTLAVFQFKIFKYSKTIFALLLPYLFWGTFATVLQLTITYLN